MIENILGVMGTGKTMCATLRAIEYQKEHPFSNIYANYHLKLPNFHFTPFMFLEYNILNDCLIICDDFYALSNLKSFVMILVNLSRKANIEVILTAQYYTMIPKQVRTISNFETECTYDKVNDILYVLQIDKNNNYDLTQVNNAVQLTKEIYDTNEVVCFPTERNIIKEIAKYSKTKNDLDLNLSLYSNNASTRRRLFKSICKEYNITE